MNARTLNSELLHQMDGYWRAANFLSVAQIYLLHHPPLERPLRLADIKHMLLGHWDTLRTRPAPVDGTLMTSSGFWGAFITVKELNSINFDWPLCP